METIIKNTLDQIQSVMGMDFDIKDQDNVKEVLVDMASKIKNQPVK